MKSFFTDQSLSLSPPFYEFAQTCRDRRANICEAKFALLATFRLVRKARNFALFMATFDLNECSHKQHKSFRPYVILSEAEVLEKE